MYLCPHPSKTLKGSFETNLFNWFPTPYNAGVMVCAVV